MKLPRRNFLHLAAGVAALPGMSYVARAQSGADAAMAVLKGEAKFSSITISVALPQVEAGTMKALALASPQRFVGMPDVPTGSEAGLPGFESEQWLAMVAPAGLPDAVAEKLNHDIGQILRDTEFAASLRRQGAEVAPGSPATLASFIAAESARLKKLVDSTGVRID